MKRIYFDCEFTGLHQDTTLISLGITSDCGKTFYAEFNDYDQSQIDPWLKENVIDNLRFRAPKEGESEHFIASRDSDNPVGNDIYRGYSVELRGSKKEIRAELVRWLNQFESVEVWGDCLAYDWVLFCQLFGHAFNLPKNVHYIPFDLCTLLKINGIDPDISREDFAWESDFLEDQGKKHNALWDAKVIRACVDRIESEFKSQVFNLTEEAKSEAILSGDLELLARRKDDQLVAVRAENAALKQRLANKVYRITCLEQNIVNINEEHAFFDKNTTRHFNEKLAEKDALINQIIEALKVSRKYPNTILLTEGGNDFLRKEIAIIDAALEAVEEAAQR
jgi:hypothetical protein